MASRQFVFFMTVIAMTIAMATAGLTVTTSGDMTWLSVVELKFSNTLAMTLGQSISLSPSMF